VFSSTRPPDLASPEVSYKRKVLLSGIVYLHRISDNRMSGSPLTNLHMFAKLCGDGATKNVVLATTMWSNVKPDIGQKREVELKSKYWAGMLDLGSQAMRFEDSWGSAWDIIDAATKSTEVQDNTLLLQEELVDLKRRLGETEAGKALYERLQKSLAEQKESIRKLRDEAQSEENEQLAKELTAQYEELQDVLQNTFDQLAKMKVPLGRRLKMLTSFRKPRWVCLHTFILIDIFAEYLSRTHRSLVGDMVGTTMEFIFEA